MNNFLSYVLLGLTLTLAIPIGPVNAAQLDKGIKGGFFPTWFVSLSAIVADGIYMAIVYLGVFHFIDQHLLKRFFGYLVALF